jgi:uncharacterized protein (DUF302 family)
MCFEDHDMAIQQIDVERFSVTSSKPFDSVIAAIEAVVGHPDMHEFAKHAAEGTSFAEFQRFVEASLGESGFMEFTRFGIGAVLQKESGQATPKIVRLVIGNPLVMKEMARHVPDAGSYAPVTILIDERADGVHLSYDRMASLLASYGSAEALKVARELDTKVEGLLTKAAA